ncbi:MAG: nucleotide exchange factor GrpE [Anaerolineales bacterium]|nr:nucleotide exchange factor GrpE [Anaerolineales bacterium]
MSEENIIVNENMDNVEAAAEETAADATASTVEELLEAAKVEAAKNLDGWQRALADLANARKRFEKQSQSAYTNATVEVVSKLLPVMDDFDRAMQNVPDELAANPWFDGLNGVLRKLNSILDGINAERIPAQGEPFDPNLHDAIMSEASDEYESGVVIRELQAGYRIGERVIRPSLVVVAS